LGHVVRSSVAANKLYKFLSRLSESLSPNQDASDSLLIFKEIEMLLRSSLIALLLISPVLSIANGVERGSVREAIQESSDDMQEDLLDMVSDAIMANCSLESTSILSTKVVKTVDKIDQGSRDFYYNILLTLSVENGKSQETISVVAAKYDISNPSVPNKEILSISSNLCR
jgi:hypothetical protein